MATIDKLDIGVYIQYARRTQFVEEVNRQYHLDEATAVKHPLATVETPKLSELDLLLGVARSYAPWAYFFPPKFKRREKGRSPFTRSKIAQSIGSEEDEDEEILDAIQTHSPEEEVEKQALKKCLKQLRTINEWLGYIIGRVGQLLQG